MHLQKPKNNYEFICNRAREKLQLALPTHPRMQTLSAKAPPPVILKLRQFVCKSDERTRNGPISATTRGRVSGRAQSRTRLEGLKKRRGGKTARGTSGQAAKPAPREPPARRKRYTTRTRQSCRAARAQRSPGGGKTPQLKPRCQARHRGPSALTPQSRPHAAPPKRERSAAHDSRGRTAN